MENLCSRIGFAEEHISKLNSLSEERLAHALLFLACKYGMKQDKTLKVSLSLEELAGYTSTSKTYLKKIASDFSVRGIASISEHTIKIFDLSAIKNIVSS